MKICNPAVVYAAILGILLTVCPTGSAQEPAVQTIFKEGKAALEDHLYKLAEDRFLGYLEKGHPSLSVAQMDAAVANLMQSMHEQKKYNKMLALLGKEKPWLSKLSGSDTIPFWKALAQYELNNYDHSLSLLSKIKGKNYSVKAEHLKAWCYLKTGKTEEAISSFKNFEHVNTDSSILPASLLDWANAIMEIRRDEGRRILNNLAAMPSSLQSVQRGQLLLGRILIEEKQSDKALNILEPLSTNSLAHADLRADTWFSLALLQETVTNRLRAVECLTNGISLATTDILKARGNQELGRLLLNMGRLDEGIPLLKNFVSSSPNDPLAGPTQLRIARTLLDNGEHKASITEFQLYLETFTNITGQAQAHSGKGWGLISSGRFAEAATEFNKAYNMFKDPSKKESNLFKVGDSYYSNNQFLLALDTYKLFVKEYPKSENIEQAHFQIAESILNSGKSSEAEKAFVKIAETFKNHPLAEEAHLRVAEIRVRVAETHDRQGRWLEGSKEFNKAINAFTEIMNVYSNGNTFAQALHGRGRALYRQRRLDEALIDFKKVTDDFPRSTVFEHSTYMRGLCHYMMAQDREAMKVWSEFVTLNPDSKWAPSILFEMAKHYYNTGDPKEAEKQFLLFVEKYPKDDLADDGLLRASKAAFRQKEYKKVVELVNKLATDYPKSKALPEARFQQVEALYQGGMQYSDAILICDEIMHKYPDSSQVILVQMRKGDSQFWLGIEDAQRYNEAIESYKAVANNSNASGDLALEALYKIGLCLDKLGKKEEALKQYHSKVMVRFLDEREKGVRHNETTKMWFWRASKASAEMMIKKEKWRKAVRILERAVEAGVPASVEAKEKIKKIKTERWWLFF